MIKDDFPYFKNHKITYLDNAATTQKPQSVIDSVVEYYTDYCANTHRSSYQDGNRATMEYEGARSYIKNFIGASSEKEVIFTKGVTEGINMVASCFVKDRFKTVIISSLEHHSNIVPWHMMGRTPGNGLEIVGYKKNLEFDMDHYEDLLRNNPGSFVSITHVSNAFGVIHPVKEIVKLAHKYGAEVLIDGAQSISSFKVNVKELGVDFYSFSGHKSYGPTGVGILYINSKLLNGFDPYQTGGATIDRVTFKSTTLLESPQCFEAGTQNIAGVIGLKAALEYIDHIGYELIEEKEKALVKIIYEKLNNIDGIELYTTSTGVVGNISFNIKGIVPIDIGIILDKMNVAVRSGHHCAMPIMDLLKINGTVRLSLGLYNDIDDIDVFFTSLARAIKIIRD